MYSDLDKSEAFLLFCNGFSYRKIAEILSSRLGCESISHSTIKNWAETPDSSGTTWEERKNDYHIIVRDCEKNSVIKQKIDIMEKTDNIIEKVLKEMEDLKFKTLDSGIYAFTKIYEFQQKIKDRTKRIAIEEQVRLLIDSMNENAEVKAVLEKHWCDIYKRFQEKAISLMKEKTRG